MSEREGTHRFSTVEGAKNKLAVEPLLLAVISGIIGFRAKKSRPRANRIIAGLLVVFYFVCGGEEISWGQRIIGFAGPEKLIAINRQQETNLHNIGSLSLFSNLFFLLTLAFFLGLPWLANRRAARTSDGNDGNLQKLWNLLPVVPTGARNAYLIALAVWLVIGIRFGTLGFHPYSLWGYYTQMDDEVFEFFAAYSFWAFSLLDAKPCATQNSEAAQIL